MMELHAFRMILNPGQEEEYRRRHDAIWPELAALRKRIAAAEDLTAKLNAAIGKIDAQLGSSELFASNPAKAAEYAKTRADFAEKLAVAEEEWLAASAAYERAVG